MKLITHFNLVLGLRIREGVHPLIHNYVLAIWCFVKYKDNFIFCVWCLVKYKYNFIFVCDA
jgi:hypothetical protein